MNRKLTQKISFYSSKYAYSRHHSTVNGTKFADVVISGGGMAASPRQDRPAAERPIAAMVQFGVVSH